MSILSMWSVEVDLSRRNLEERAWLSLEEMLQYDAHNMKILKWDTLYAT